MYIRAEDSCLLYIPGTLLELKLSCMLIVKSSNLHVLYRILNKDTVSVHLVPGLVLLYCQACVAVLSRLLLYCRACVTVLSSLCCCIVWPVLLYCQACVAVLPRLVAVLSVLCCHIVKLVLLY